LRRKKGLSVVIKGRGWMEKKVGPLAKRRIKMEFIEPKNG